MIQKFHADDKLFNARSEFDLVSNLCLSMEGKVDGLN